MKRSRGPIHFRFIIAFILLISTPASARHLDGTVWDIQGIFKVGVRGCPSTDRTTLFSAQLTFFADRTFELGNVLGDPMACGIFVGGHTVPIQGAWFDQGSGGGFVGFSSNLIDLVTFSEVTLALQYGSAIIDVTSVSAKGKVNQDGTEISGIIKTRGTIQLPPFGDRKVSFTIIQKFTGVSSP